MTPQWPLTVTNHPPLHHISHKLSENIQYMGSNSRKRKRPLYPPFSDTVLPEGTDSNMEIFGREIPKAKIEFIELQHKTTF